jgi:hypothetical protein
MNVYRAFRAIWDSPGMRGGRQFGWHPGYAVLRPRAYFAQVRTNAMNYLPANLNSVETRYLTRQRLSAIQVGLGFTTPAP